MAKVAAKGLPWLSKPSTGYDLFTRPVQNTSQAILANEESGVVPKRLIATRGSELFVGRGNEVRCADLQDLKARHPQIACSAEGAKKVGHREHKVLNLPQLDFEIRQLEISHDDLYLAIVGETEIAVCVLPGEGFLKRDAARPSVPHFHKVGQGLHNPDTGVNIVRVLWHPLGVEGSSLVVLTDDGHVRTYDFTIGNDISFEVPDQSLDLYLLNGRKRHNGGFSADTDEMVPASMCFGSGDQGWRPFTLYILMRSGDVYALTPVVPSRWNVSRDYIQRLSLEITSELDSFDEQTSLELKSVIRHQTKWINDVLNQQAVIANAQLGFSTPRAQIPSCFKRPEVVGPSPVLQGPFLFDPAPVETGGEDYPAACDIFHLEAGPVGVIGIVYSDGKLDICLETDPITAKWVDKKRKPKAKAPGDHSGLPVIASYETINLQISAGNDSEYTSWPVFTPDPHSNQLWFVNHRTGVVAFSMKGWLGKLEEVLEDDEDGDFLTRMLENSPRSLVQNIVDTSGSAVDGCAVVYEAYIGYLLVAGHRNGLSSVEFDEPVGAPAFLSPEDSADNSIILDPPQRHRFAASVASTPRRFQSPDDSFSMPKSSQQQQQQQQPTPITLPAVPKVSILQPPYQASPEFTRPSALPEFLRGLRHAKQPFMFSSTTLKKFREARDTLKAEFDALMSGAQEMHDRAAAQRLEYSKQLETLNSIDARLGALQSKAVRERLERFITRQEALQERADTLLRRLIVDSEVGLSDAEKKWSREVNLMMMRVIGEEGTDTLSNRQFAVSELVDDLVPAAEEVEEDGEVGKDMVPKEVREATLKGLRQMIDRQDTLVSSTRKRLEGLCLESERIA